MKSELSLPSRGLENLVAYNEPWDVEVSVVMPCLNEADT